MAKSARKHNAPWTPADLKKMRALAKQKMSARLAAKELGGELIARSEGRGKGATFTLELPRTPQTHT